MLPDIGSPVPSHAIPCQMVWDEASKALEVGALQVEMTNAQTIKCNRFEELGTGPAANFDLCFAAKASAALDLNKVEVLIGQENYLVKYFVDLGERVLVVTFYGPIDKERRLRQRYGDLQR